MRITVYQDTRLKSDYNAVVPDITAYLDMLGRQGKRAFIDVPPLNGGGDSLRVQFTTTIGQGTTFLPSYAIDYATVGGVHYFVENVEKVSDGVYGMDMTLDVWHNQSTLRVTGAMVSAHDMVDHVVGLRPALRLPINPTRGDFIESANIFNDNFCCAVGHFTAYIDNIERDVLMISQPELVQSQGMIGAVNIMARAKNISPDGQTAHEVKSVNAIYVVPQSLLRLPNEVNASLLFAGPTSEQERIYTCYYRDDNSVDVMDVNDVMIARDGLPLVTTIGNHGANITLDVVTTSRHAHIVTSYNGVAGTLSIELRANGQSVDLLPSMTASFSASRINERQQAHDLNKVTRIANAAVGVVGNVMKLNVGGAMQSGVALTSGIIDNTQQTRVDTSSQEGVFAVNCRAMTTGGVIDTIPCIGIMRHAASNADVVCGAVDKFGFTGRAKMVNFDLKKYYRDPFAYTAIYRRFDDTHMVIDCDFQPQKCRPAIEAILKRGTTIFNAGNVLFEQGGTYDRPMTAPVVNWSITP